MTGVGPFRRLGGGVTAAAFALFAGVLASLPALAFETTTFKAGYVISLGGIVVGHASAESRFSGNGYAAAIKGSTGGVSRLVTDASAKLAGTGRILGTRILPASYDLDTKENGLATRVRMAMQGGSITNVVAVPGLAPAEDRIPLTPGHKANVLDPIGAFMIPIDRPGIPSGHRACNRTVKVFDGWTRFDVQLYYKETKAVDGSSGSYAGRVIVCGARFVPVAGHRPSRDAIRSMANNRRLEVWLAQIKDMPLLVPYRIIIGTKMGDLIVHATRFSTDKPEQRAEAK